MLVSAGGLARRSWLVVGRAVGYRAVSVEFNDRLIMSCSGRVTRLRMALAPRRSDAVDVLAADGPGVDDQRPRDPL